VLCAATCQFPVAPDVGANLDHVKRQMVTACRRGARVAHFPEGALSGYAGTDFQTFAGFDWDRLGEANAEDTRQDLYDSAAAWRERAMTGTLHSGNLVSNPRSDDRSHP
jgi:predicted amidohydrolase